VDRGWVSGVKESMDGQAGSGVGYEPTDADEYRTWAIRYLGQEAGERFFESLEDSVRTMVTV
jgi:hypothetical protein